MTRIITLYNWRIKTMHTGLKIFFIFILFALLITPFFFIYPYLNYTKKVNTKILIVEGWISELSLSSVVILFQNGFYDQIITVGCPYNDPIRNPYNLSGAELAYNYLINAGISKQNITAVPAPTVNRHKTLTAAIFLKHWMKNNNFIAASFNIVTESVHTRKSYITYKRVFPDNEIGVITFPERIYSKHFMYLSKKNWFLSKKGIYLVMKNLVGCFYANCVNIEKVEKNLFKQP